MTERAAFFHFARGDDRIVISARGLQTREHEIAQIPDRSPLIFELLQLPGLEFLQTQLPQRENAIDMKRCRARRRREIRIEPGIGGARGGKLGQCGVDPAPREIGIVVAFDAGGAKLVERVRARAVADFSFARAAQ